MAEESVEAVSCAGFLNYRDSPLHGSCMPLILLNRHAAACRPTTLSAAGPRTGHSQASASASANIAADYCATSAERSNRLDYINPFIRWKLTTLRWTGRKALDADCGLPGWSRALQETRHGMELSMNDTVVRISTKADGFTDTGNLLLERCVVG